jgi:CheY-like chemotaxis protein
MSPTRCQSILIVEDNPEIRETVAEILRLEGYDVYPVPDGKQALRMLRHVPSPTLILLDMMMPVMSGWEFLEAQHADAKFAHLPVVVMSALKAPQALHSESEPLDVRGYLRKPVDLETLLEIVALYCLRSFPSVSDRAEGTDQVAATS